MDTLNRGFAVPVTCRFVPTDQWMSTHLNSSWKIAEVKLWLLAKFNPSSFSSMPKLPRALSSQKRPVSPIRFASTQQIHVKAVAGSVDAYYHEDDYDEDEDDFGDDLDDLALDKYKYPALPRSSTASAPRVYPVAQSVEGTSSDPAAYTLLSFSTGQLLEDHFALSWYSLLPHELLELHISPHIVKLPRHLYEEYVQPYFEVKVWALRVVARDSSGKKPDVELKSKEPERKYSDGDEKAAESFRREKLAKKHRNVKLEWRERWVVIHQGLFKLCRDRNDFKPTHISPLSSILALRGAEHLQGSPSLLTRPSSSSSAPQLNTLSSSPSKSHIEKQTPRDNSKTIVCVKFQSDKHESHDTKSKSSAPDTSSNSNWWRRGSKDANAWASVSSGEGRRGSRGGLEGCDIEDDPPSGNEDSKEKEKGKEVDTGVIDDGIWIVMDMLEDCAFQNILRLLHRHAPTQTPSSFLSNSNPSHSQQTRDASPIYFSSKTPQPSSPSSPERSPGLLAPFDWGPLRVPSIPRTPYPDWRLSALKRACVAGLGDVGGAMEWMKFGIHAERDSGDDTTIGEAHSRGRRERQMHRTTASKDLDDMELHLQGGIMLDEFASDSEEDESASEMEWEGWVEDVKRRRRASRIREKRSGKVGEGEGIQWDSNWNWTAAESMSWGTHTQQNSGASSPRPEGYGSTVESVDSMFSQSEVHHPLIRYASADSLHQGTITRTVTTKSSNGRHGSPVRGGSIRIRPRSPLSEGLDDDRLGVANQSTHSLNSAYIHSVRSHTSEPNPHMSFGGQRVSMPMNMAMTTITSTVTVGNPESSSSSTSTRKQRKRSSTVVLASSPSSSLNASTRGSGNDTLKAAFDKLGAKAKNGKDKLHPKRSKHEEQQPPSNGGPFKPAKLKLVLPFTQVSSSAADGSSRPLPSATSASSFESPRFASPSESSDGI